MRDFYCFRQVDVSCVGSLFHCYLVKFQLRDMRARTKGWGKRQEAERREIIRPKYEDVPMFRWTISPLLSGSRVTSTVDASSEHNRNWRRNGAQSAQSSLYRTTTIFRVHTSSLGP
jgi:hypothetical protein